MPKIRTSVLSALFSLILLISFGTWAYERIEGWTFGQSFYFSVATLTTVGYGDIHPTTDASRIFTAIYILVGVGIVIAALTSIGSKYLYTQEKELSNNIARRIHRREEKDTKQK
jgi:voltage-gated potassium channel Kch